MTGPSTPLRATHLVLFAAALGCSTSAVPAPQATAHPKIAADTGPTTDLAPPDTEAPDRPESTPPDTAPLAPTFPATDPAPDCDPLVPMLCALPFPSSRWLVTDPTTKTGLRLQFGPTTLPTNINHEGFDPGPFERFDGFGVGSPILTHFKDLDLTGLPTELNPAPSMDPTGPSILLAIHQDGTATRVPHLIELDQTAELPDRALLYMRPLVILEEATQYIVAFRDLKTQSGSPVPPSPAFKALRDNATGDSFLDARQPHFDALFKHLEDASFGRQDLIAAWDFSTASSDTLHRDLLSMRDQAFALAGPSGPALTIQEIEVLTPEQDPYLALRIRGTFHVPNFMRPIPIDQETGALINRDDLDHPAPNGWTDPTFWLQIPRSALDGTPHGLVQYGHGLMGQGSQVRGGFISKIAFDHHLIFFACNLTGMSSPDVSAILAMMQHLQNFAILPEKVHQGLIESLLLARAMRERLSALPALTNYDLQIDKGRLFFSGISQGGIYGGTYMALSQDITRGHLGVPGQNYSLLVPRSTDFVGYFALLRALYPQSVERGLLLGAVQTLWDTVDPVSYYRHLAALPFGNTPKHQVLLAEAVGDLQVAPLTNEISARSGLGIALMAHYGKPVFGVAETPYPHTGSGLVSYSFGNAWAPPGNLPPPDKPPGDPHGKPRHLDHHNAQMVHFFDTGEIIDVCGGDGCTPD